METKKILGAATLLLALGMGSAYAQVGMPTNNPQRNAQLDLNGANSQNNKGLLLPRVSLVATDNVAPLIGTVLSGMKVYNLATAGAGATAVTPGEYYYDGTKWVRIAAEGSASSGGAEPWYDVATQAGATANTQNIYQMGKVGIGKNNPQAQLDVSKDALINSVTVGRGGASEEYSTAVGYQALKSITSGNCNIAVGHSTLTACTTGTTNVAVGTSSLKQVTTGGSNTGIGFATLYTLVTGGGNVALGHWTLNAATGSGNTALGAGAGITQKGGNFNIMIGNDANVPDINGSNQMNIGNLIFANGMSSTTADRLAGKGNVGIGTPTPSMKLHVFGTAGYLLKVQKQSGNGGSGISVDGGITDWGIASTGTGDQATGQFWIVNRNNANIPFAIAPNNNIGMGTYNPMSKLHVNGTMVVNDGTNYTGNIGLGTSNRDGVQIGGEGVIGIQSGGQPNLYLSKGSGNSNAQFITFRAYGSQLGDIHADSNSSIAINYTSDKRLKENIVGSHYGIADLMKMNIYDYNYKADSAKTLNTGVLAQELREVYPNAVTVGGADAKTDPWMVDYIKIVPVLIKGIQDQQAQIEALKKEVEMLKSK